MRDYQKQMLIDFTEYEKTRGFRNYLQIKYLMKVFFEYLNDNDLDFKQFKYCDAQNYQTYLSTLTDKRGKVHYSVSSIEGLLAACKNFYNYLKFLNLIYSNPFNGIRKIQKAKLLPKNLPDEKKMEAYLKSFRCFWKGRNLTEKKQLYRVHVISELMYSTGMRINEVSELELDDIDFERNTVRIKEGKGGKERLAYMNEYAARVLKIYIEKVRRYIVVDQVNRKEVNNKLFGMKSSHALCIFLNNHLKKSGAEHELSDFTTHHFRHSVGYHLLKNGCDMRYIQIILGHDKLSSTSIYTKVHKKDLLNELDKYHPRQFKKSSV